MNTLWFPTRRAPRLFRGRAFSIIEVVIALFLLAVTGLGLIQVFRQAGNRGESFSSEHFTAMFLSQKIMEDVNSRIRENPHFFSQLIASAAGEITPVTDGKTVYFDLLENTVNFSYLNQNEDRPIDAESAEIFRQLQDFRCQVECRLDVPADPVTGQPFRNLIEVVVHISWTDSQKRVQTYRLSQYVFGVDRSTFDSAAGLLTANPIRANQAGKGLWYLIASASMPDPPTLSSFLTFNGGGDAQVIETLGKLVYADLKIQVDCDFANGRIASLQQLRDAALAMPDPQRREAAEYQEQIGEAFEQKASAILSQLIRTLPALTSLKGVTITPSALGDKLGGQSDKLHATCWSLAVAVDQVPLNFSGAEDASSSLLAAPYAAWYPVRKVNPLLRRILDLEKVTTILTTSWEDQENSLGQIRQRIQQWRTQFDGQQPILLDYLAVEGAICQSLSRLRTYFGGSGGLAGILDQVRGSRDRFLALELKIP